MNIIVNHLTRMSAGYICVAGVDLDTGKHVRPVVFGQIPSDMLEPNGGPFNMANFVDLGRVRPLPNLPKVEDNFFEQRNARKVGSCKPNMFWQLLETISVRNFRTIFGNELVFTPQNRAYLPQAAGKASLGCLIPATPPELSISIFQGKSKVRVSLNDGERMLDLPVADIRCYNADYTVNEYVVAQLNRMMKQDQVAVSIGVTSLYTSAGQPPAHWLQLNSIHLKGLPAMRLR